MQLIIILAVFFSSLAVPAVSAALICSASVQPLVFGTVRGIAGQSSNTESRIVIACHGGETQTAKVCISITPYSSGTRTMLSASADQLGFTLTAEAPYSYGGRLWADEWVEIALDYKGDGAAEIPLFAETVPFGETTRPGHYSGQLSSPADIRLEFGEGACYQSSQIEDVQVTAEVVSSCAIDVEDLNFGQIDSRSALPAAANAAVSVACTKGTNWRATLDMGQHPLSGERRMSNGSGMIAYGLYRDRNSSEPWDSTGVEGTAIGTGQTFMVYGQLVPEPSANAGNYSDKVLILIEYDQGF